MSRPIRVLFLTQYFPPETGAPPVRLFEMARWLVKRGIEVEVLTALPNYPQGRVYDAYRGKLWVTEEQDGIRVIHAPIYPSRSARFLPRMTNYFSFVFSSVIFGLLLARRPDVILCESPPLFLGLSALFLKTVYWCRLIFNVSDLWPETAIRMGMYTSRPIVWIATRLELLCYRGSDAATGQSLGIVRGILAKHPKGMVELIPNGCDCDLFQPNKRDDDLRRRHGLQDKVVVGYAGLVGLAQGVGVLIDVAERFRNDDRVRFLVAGDGPEREQIEQELKTRGLPNVIFTGWLAKSAMPGMVALFDMAFIPLRYFIPGALPSKIYEAMASQVPIILAAQGDPKELLERARAGIPVDYDDLDDIEAAIRRLADNAGERERLGRNGRDYVLAHHQRHIIAERLAGVIETVVTGRKAIESLPERKAA